MGVGGGGGGWVLQTLKGNQVEVCKSSTLLPNPSWSSVAGSIGYDQVIYLLVFLLMDILGPSSALSVSSTH